MLFASAAPQSASAALFGQDPPELGHLASGQFDEVNPHLAGRHAGDLGDQPDDPPQQLRFHPLAASVPDLTGDEDRVRSQRCAAMKWLPGWTSVKMTCAKLGRRAGQFAVLGGDGRRDVRLVFCRESAGQHCHDVGGHTRFLPGPGQS